MASASIATFSNPSVHFPTRLPSPNLSHAVCKGEVLKHTPKKQSNSFVHSLIISHAVSKGVLEHRYEGELQRISDSLAATRHRAARQFRVKLIRLVLLTWLLFGGEPVSA